MHRSGIWPLALQSENARTARIMGIFGGFPAARGELLTGATGFRVGHLAPHSVCEPYATRLTANRLWSARPTHPHLPSDPHENQQPTFDKLARTTRSTITTNKTLPLSHPPTQHTRQPSMRSPTTAGSRRRRNRVCTCSCSTQAS